MRYLLNIGIALDQLLNALIGGFPDETLSARAYRDRWKGHRWWVAYKLINFIFFWQHDHCFESYNAEVERKHLHADYRS